MLYNLSIEELRKIYIYKTDLSDDELIEFYATTMKNMEILSKKEAIKQKQKLHTDYNGTDVSLTSKDAVGLLQVKAAFELGVTKTQFLFANGTVMDMTPAVFAEFAPWFAVKRNELFTS